MSNKLALVSRMVHSTSSPKLSDSGLPEDVFYAAIAARAKKLEARVMLL